MPGFRFNAKQCFLTYPRCGNLTKDEVLSFFMEFELEFWCIGLEDHADGEGKHIHAWLSFKKKLDKRDPRWWDIREFHPHSGGTVRKRGECIEYCKKDGDYIENLPFGTKTSWASCVNARSREEFLSRVEECSPRDWILQHDKIFAYADWKYPSNIISYNPPSNQDFQIPQEIRDWLLTWDQSRPKTLFLCGPTRTGKTCWARSLGEHMYFCCMFNLNDWSNSAQYLVIDDFNWEFFPNKKGFWGAQDTFTLTDKYKGKRTVKWGKPMIYICNPDQDPFNHPSMLREGAKDFFIHNCIQIYNFNFIK